MKTGRKKLGFRRLLPSDREIIVRTGDSVSYLRLPSWFQTSVLLAATVALAWIGLATLLNFNHLEIIAKREARIADTEKARRELAQDLDAAREGIDIARRRAASARERAERVTDLNRKLQADVEALEKRLSRERDAFEEVDDARQKLTGEVAGLRQQLTELDAQRKRQLGELDAQRARDIAAIEKRLRAKIAALDSERQSLSDRAAQLLADAERSRDEKATLTGHIAGLEQEIDDLESERAKQNDIVAALRDDLSRMHAEHDRVARDRDNLASERDEIAGRFASLSDQLAVLETAQEQIVDRFDSQTVDSIALVEKTLAMTRVDVDRLLRRMMSDAPEDQSSGVGGPFIAAIDAAGGEQASELANNIAAVEQRVTRWRGLQSLLARLPLTVPLDNFRVTSTFGRRMDPMSGRLAMHEGIDFVSAHRAEVRATSPGKVVFVGWRGGYGKLVEVDHGLGIRTRYAHLSKIYVKAGQAVDFRDKLGQVGNTGRSTGEHLHYEVVVDGRALDPANFMRAGQYVFKN